MVDHLIAIRHGMRLDFEDPLWIKKAQRPYDPPLSKNGVKQAQETAVFLKDAGIGEIFSSPFYRTLQTANIIAGMLGLKVKVEAGFSEWLNEEWFTHIPGILTQEQILDEFEYIDTDYTNLIYPRFPEYRQHKEVYERVKRVLKVILRKCKGTAVIIGHGAILDEIARSLEISPDEVAFGMCAVNIFKRQNKKWKLDYASNKHVSRSNPDFDNRFR